VSPIEPKTIKDKTITDNYLIFNAINASFSTVGFIDNQNVFINKIKETEIFLLLRINEVFARLVYEFIALGLLIFTIKSEVIFNIFKNKVDVFIVSIGDYKYLTKSCFETINNEILRNILIRSVSTKVEQILKDLDSNQISKLIKDLK